MKDLAKVYDPKKYEDEIYRRSEDSGFFNPDVCVKKGVAQADAPAYSIVLPPPNVTGTLHIGHAAMLAIQDILIRYHRMLGNRTLWLPGTDHAAIATESKVEKLLMDEGMAKPKETLGREAFLARVNEYAQASHDTIVNQCRKMGASLDWSREAYTLDEQRNLAVRTVFKMMYDDGLIYRGHRLVNWDPVMQSNVADDEIEWKEETAPFYYFQYGPFVISTARPETKFGDKYVVMHPKDKRYKKYKHGDKLTVEWINGRITATIIKDEAVDPEFGTGVMTITPWHDAVDFDIAERHGLDKEQIIDFNGRLLPIAGEFAGRPIAEARSFIVEKLKEKGLVARVEENYLHRVATNYRGGAVLEPQIREQWFVDVNKPFVFKGSGVKGIKKGASVTLKQVMQKVVKSGQIKIVPERFTETYFRWIDNLRDWCISRQIWFGHRVPVRYDVSAYENRNGFFTFKNNKNLGFVQKDKEDVYKQEGHLNISYTTDGNGKDLRDIFMDFATATKFVKSGKTTFLKLKSFASSINVDECELGVPFLYNSEIADFDVADPDTLDTWFSAGLWTFSTLGWPGSNPQVAPGKLANDLANYHPTSVLETGYDIIFFWVARMILMTTYALGEIPFYDVYLHGLVRDEQGRKMSKSLGNVIDPLDMIARYGTDATRLSLVLGATPGNDLKLSEEKIAGFRNFANKLWNIARFILLKIGEPKLESVRPASATLSDRWILGRLDETARAMRESVENYNFSAGGERLRDFTWGELADWYLEATKIEGDKSDMLNYILNTLLKLWHPYMPFVTEALWSEMYGRERLLMVEKYPEAVGELNKKDVAEFALVQEIVNGIRSLRAEFHVPADKKLPVVISAHRHSEAVKENAAVITALAGLAQLRVETKVEKPDGAVGFIASGAEVFLDLKGAVDVNKEKARLEKELASVAPYVSALAQKLKNREFLKNAPPAVVASERDKFAAAETKLNKLKIDLELLS